MSAHEPDDTPEPDDGSEPSWAPGPARVGGNPGGYGGGPYGRGQYGGYTNQDSLLRGGAQPGVALGFSAAIRRFYAKYAQFSGRASRSEFWWAALYLAVICLVLSILSSTAGTNRFGELNSVGMVLSILTFAFVVAHMIPNIAVSVRPLHDVNLSGWLILLCLLPFVGGIIVLVLMALPPKSQGARFDR